MLYERRAHRLLPWRAFGLRMARHGAAALGVTLLSLGFGMAGYLYYEDLPWRIVFLVVGGIVMAPILHRLLHHFHWEQKTKDDN